MFKYCNVCKSLTFTVFLRCIAPLNVLMYEDNTCFGIIPTFYKPADGCCMSHWFRCVLVHFSSLPVCQIVVSAGYIPCCTHSFNSILDSVHTKAIYLRWNFNFLLRQRAHFKTFFPLSHKKMNLFHESTAH